VGLPRSGTSWLARAISLSPRVSYYFEPDKRLGSEYMYRFLPAAATDPMLSAFINKSFHGRVHDEYTIAEQGLSEILSHPFSRTVLVKLVRLPLALDWLAAQFPDMRVLQIVRHPAPQFLSWRYRKWNPGRALQMLLGQRDLINGPLSPYKDTMRYAGTFWEQAGAFWGAVATLQLHSHREGWYLFEHEWYCGNAVARIGWQIEQLGLSWSPEIEKFITGGAKRSSGPGYGKHRDPVTEIHKWEGKLSAAELRELETTLKIFNLPFYPGLDPEHTWQSGNRNIP
jgi:hypothetical protein